jgi:hypothetical protein
MVPDLPGTPASSSFDSETGILTCTFGTIDEDYSFFADLKIVLTVRGHVELLEASGGVSIFGNGMGEVEINYDFSQSQGPDGPV